MVALLIATAATSPTAAARQGGGGTIASAPTVTPGTQEFGNTADGKYQYYGQDYGADFWKLSLIAADHVTVDWESTYDSGCGCWYVDRFLVWPKGTTDYSINNVDPFQKFYGGGNGKAESSFTANATGAFPIMFVSVDENGGTGPYDFTVRVRHLPRIKMQQLPTRVSSGMSAKVTAYFADGKPISGAKPVIRVRGQWQGAWHSLGSGTPTNGLATIKLVIPSSARGMAVKFQATASGGAYVSVKTPTQTRTVG